MRWLIDNNVLRGVTRFLRDQGHEATEVRQVLADNAPDSVVAAYAAAEGLVVVTHDRGLARRCLLSAIPHLWLRTREPDDEERMRQTLPDIEEALEAGSVRIVASRRTLT